MAITTFKSNVRVQDGFTLKCDNNNENHVIFDEPEAMGGKDLGMNPCEGLLSSLGACQTMAGKAFAKARGINLKDIWVEVEGDIDLSGFMGVEGVKIGFQEIRSTIHISADNTQEEIQDFVRFIERTCPVGDTINNPATIVAIPNIIK